MLPIKCIKPPWMNMEVSMVAHVGMGEAMLNCRPDSDSKT